jgi:hypothetical protein
MTVSPVISASGVVPRLDFMLIRHYRNLPPGVQTPRTSVLVDIQVKQQ